MSGQATERPWTVEVEAEPEEGCEPLVYVCHPGTVCDVTVVCTMGDSRFVTLEEKVTTAELIVRAVNERDALIEALTPFAKQHTIAEILAGAVPSDWMDASVERRIEMIGERKRQNDANILRARAALSKAGRGV